MTMPDNMSRTDRPSNAELIEAWHTREGALPAEGDDLADRLAAYGDVTPEDVRWLLSWATGPWALTEKGNEWAREKLDSLPNDGGGA